MGTTKAYLKSELVDVTPDMARMLRTTSHFERQRLLREPHIDRLAGEMAKGSFVAGTQVFIAVLPDKSMRILNGNHTLEAVAKGTFPVALTLTYHPVKDIDDAGRLYAQFDIQRTRTWGDAYKAYGYDAAIPSEWMTKVGSALGMIIGGFSHRTEDINNNMRSRDLRAQFMEKYKSTAMALIGCMENPSGEALAFMKRRSILSIALETMRHQPSSAVEFWSGFVRDDGLRAGNPRKTLLQYLRKYGSANNLSHAIEQATAATLAWNAFYKGKEITVLRPGRVEDFRIQGTPWTHEGYDPLAEFKPAPVKLSTRVKANNVDVSFLTGILPGAESDRPVAYFAV